MTTVFLGDIGTPIERFYDWVDDEESMRSAVRVMEQLHVVSVEKTDYSSMVKLHDKFREQILGALRSEDLSGRPWSNNEGLPEDDEVPAKEYLRRFDNVCWISLLHYLTESDVSGVRQPTESVREILVRMGLKRVEDERTTARGYEFVLFDKHHQMWNILKRYIECSKERKVDILRVILRLSFCTLGTQCVVGETSPSLLQDLGNFGLLYYKQPGHSLYFYPTMVGVNVAFGITESDNQGEYEERMRKSREVAGAIARGQDISAEAITAADGGSSGMQIIVETNFRLYCYTDPPNGRQVSEDMALVHHELLKLFVDVHVLLPNMIVGNITRRSITRAVERGIETNRIVDFLKVHAHPECYKRSKTDFYEDDVVPENVIDQIYIWGQELKRVTTQDVGLLYDFDDEKHFAFVLRYAHDLDVCVWHNDELRRMCVVKEAINAMKVRSLEYYTSSEYKAS